MKRLSLIFALLFSAIIITKAQNNADNKQTIGMLKHFYTAYMTEFASSDEPRVSEKKLDSLKRVFCTARFLKKIPGIIEQTDADPVIKAQDSNADCVKNLSVTKSTKGPNLFIVSYFYIDYTTRRKETTTINVALAEQNGAFKIDNIW